MAPRLREALLKRGSPLPRWLALFFLLAACAAIIVALARPRGDAGTKTEKTLGRNVMIALDISKSMRVSDVKPDRLTQAKIVIYELLEAMPNERIGFIGFAGTPYVYAPLTIDHSAVREIVDQIDENWAPLGGSDLAAAVHLATETLKKTGQKNNALVILSDGEKTRRRSRRHDRRGRAIRHLHRSPSASAPRTAASSRIRISRTARWWIASGRTVISRLQTDVHAQARGRDQGTLQPSPVPGLDIPAMVKSVVDGLDAFEMEGRERRISIEFYQWLMFPAILFLIVSIIAGTRWKGIQTAILVAGAISNANRRATPARPPTPRKRWPAKHYEQARDAYHKLAEKRGLRETQARYRLGEATAAYRAGISGKPAPPSASRCFPGDSKVQASGHLGMGNSLVPTRLERLVRRSLSHRSRRPCRISTASTPSSRKRSRNCANPKPRRKATPAASSNGIAHHQLGGRR